MNKCGTCVLQTLKRGVCPIFNVKTDEDDCCPYYCETLNPCELCGTHILNGAIIEIDEMGNSHQFCGKCGNLDPCQLCQEATECVFDSDTSCSEPPIVTVTQQNGNIRVQSQQINPKRIEATCAKGCNCYIPNEEYHCLRKLGTGCSKYRLRKKENKEDE